MVGEKVKARVGRRLIEMVVTESELVFEPENDRRGFKFVMRRPKGTIYYEGWLAMGADEVTEVRESAAQVKDLNREDRSRWS